MIIITIIIHCYNYYHSQRWFKGTLLSLPHSEREYIFIRTVRRVHGTSETTIPIRAISCWGTHITAVAQWALFSYILVPVAPARPTRALLGPRSNAKPSNMAADTASYRQLQSFFPNNFTSSSLSEMNKFCDICEWNYVYEAAHYFVFTLVMRSRWYQWKQVTVPRFATQKRLILLDFGEIHVHAATNLIQIV